MRVFTEIFEVEVEVGNVTYMPLLSVEATFELTDDGPEKLSLDLICELPSPDYEPLGSLTFTMEELSRIRFAVADAIERKYWSGEYSSIFV